MPTSSGGAVVSYSVSPALPTGLGLDTSTGAVYGTPSEPTAAASYTVAATNSGGNATVSLSVAVGGPFPTQELLAYYPFNGDATDASGNGYNGIVNGATSTTDRFGEPGRAYGFDSLNSFINTSMPTVNISSGAQVTVVFWMYWDGTTGSDGSARMPIGFAYYDLEIYAQCLGFNTGNADCYGASGAGLANRWVNVAAIFTNGSVSGNSIYIDGVKQPLNQYASHPLGRTVSSSMTIGGWPLDGNYRFGGKLDDVRIYNRALSDAEVLLLSQ